MGYIYKITNSVNDKLYIGKTTTTIENRWKQHLDEANRKREYKSKLYSAMNKYGSDKFSISQIEKCDNSIINEREKYWIKKYKTVENGYNITFGGDGYNVISDAEINKILELWQQGLTQKDISKTVSRNHKAIKRILYENGVTRKQILDRQNEVTRYSRIKPIYFYDLDGNFLKGYDSLTEASKDLGIDKTTLGHVLKGRQKSIHEMMLRPFKANKIEPIERKATSYKIEVHQYSLNGEYINSYPSYQEAMRAVGLKDPKSIRNCCKGIQKTGRGFYWRLYRTDNLNEQKEI